MSTSPDLVRAHPRGRMGESKALPYALGAGAILGVLAISAVVNAALAKKAERDNPPTGKFVDVQGVRIHYVDRGEGEPLVLLHGNGSSVEDFESSGLIRLASKQFQVISFDRPGFGHTPRPTGRTWTPEAQAELFAAALRKELIKLPERASCFPYKRPAEDMLGARFKRRVSAVMREFTIGPSSGSGTVARHGRGHCCVPLADNFELRRP